jgi:hypothetical protein
MEYACSGDSGLAKVVTLLFVVLELLLRFDKVALRLIPD